MTSGRFVLFSDLHVHSWPEHNPAMRLVECVSVIAEVREYCVQHGITRVVFAGDMFHKRGIVHTTAYVMVANELRLCKEAGLDVVGCGGNHDQEDREGTIDALQPLAAGGLMTIPDNKGYLVHEHFGVALCLFNYCDDAATIRTRIKAVRSATKSSEVKIAIFHHGFTGARVGSALEYVVKEPIDAKALKLDKYFDATFSGHYHEHQRIKGTKRGWYIGSPLEHTRSDYDEEERVKGFLDVEVDDGDVTFDLIAIKRPRFVKVLVGTDVLRPEDIDGNFIDLVYDDAKELAVAKAKCLKHGARGVKVVPLPGAKAVNTAQRMDVSPAAVPKVVLKKYLKHERDNIKSAKLDKHQLLQVGLELIQEVL